MRLRHLPDDRQRYSGDVQIIDAPVAVAQKRAGPSIYGPDHSLFRLPLKPAVDVAGEEPHVTVHHPLIVLPGDTQIVADLAVGGSLYLQRFDQVEAIFTLEMEHGPAIPVFHDDAVGIYQIVLLGLTLAQDLRADFLYGTSRFHVMPLLSHHATAMQSSRAVAARPACSRIFTSVTQHRFCGKSCNTPCTVSSSASIGRT